MREYDNEPVPGLPERLPKGERIIWQGSPRWQSLTRQIFHPVSVTVYYGVLATWFFLAALYDGRPFSEAVSYIGYTAIVAGISIGLLCALGFVMSRTTMYTITNRRIVMRFGVAFPMAVNLPFSSIESADLKLWADGSGNVPLRLTGDGRLAYLHMWPHVRPGRYREAEPMLRAMPNAQAVSQVLAEQWGAATSEASAARAPSASQRRNERLSPAASPKPRGAVAAA
jgi:hypothetical protein